MATSLISEMFANVAWNDLYSLLRHSITDFPIIHPLSKGSIDQATLYPNLVNFRPIISEFTQLKRAILVCFISIH